jgi:hypothetical protein
MYLSDLFIYLFWQQEPMTEKEQINHGYDITTGSKLNIGLEIGMQHQRNTSTYARKVSSQQLLPKEKTTKADSHMLNYQKGAHRKQKVKSL